MPCSCAGYPVEETRFGKKYTGVLTTAGSPDYYEKMVAEGEETLCQCQYLLYQLFKFAVKNNIQMEPQHEKAILWQLKMHRDHKKAQGEDVSDIDDLFVVVAFKNL